MATWTSKRLSGLGVLAGLAVVFASGTGVRYRPYDEVLRDSRPTPLSASASDGPELSERDAGRSALDRAASGTPYIVVDQANNRLYVRRAGTVLLEAICSAGSGAVLRDPVSEREWTFDTPRGRFEVLARARHPVWRKPDWAFVEAGEAIPTNVGDRLEPGTLGEYALYFGNGYMIHGTLYERLLGRSVTHGCIRLGRDDLRALWKLAPLGTPIIIF